MSVPVNSKLSLLVHPIVQCKHQALTWFGLPAEAVYQDMCLESACLRCRDEQGTVMLIHLTKYGATVRH